MAQSSVQQAAFPVSAQYIAPRVDQRLMPTGTPTVTATLSPQPPTTPSRFWVVSQPTCATRTPRVRALFLRVSALTSIFDPPHTHAAADAAGSGRLLFFAGGAAIGGGGLSGLTLYIRNKDAQRPLTEVCGGRCSVLIPYSPTTLSAAPFVASTSAPFRTKGGVPARPPSFTPPNAPRLFCCGCPQEEDATVVSETDAACHFAFAGRAKRWVSADAGWWLPHWSDAEVEVSRNRLLISNDQPGDSEENVPGRWSMTSSIGVKASGRTYIVVPLAGAEVAGVQVQGHPLLQQEPMPGGGNGVSDLPGNTSCSCQHFRLQLCHASTARPWGTKERGRRRRESRRGGRGRGRACAAAATPRPLVFFAF